MLITEYMDGGDLRSAIQENEALFSWNQRWVGGEVYGGCLWLSS